MSQRAANRSSATLVAAASILFALAVAFPIRARSVPTGDDVSSAPSEFANMLGGLAFAIVGAFIISRRRENAVQPAHVSLWLRPMEARR
jgi:hypothetical protein